MPRGKQSRGRCAFCGYETSKGAISRHLASCTERQAAVVKAEQSKRTAEKLYHLRVQDAYSSDFWLDLEVRGSATLNHIDSYLRAIWLECCGHLSQFSVGGWGGHEIGKQRRVEAVFQDGVEVTHIYDFGTSSETRLKAVGQRTGAPLSAKPITLMARNLMPEALCAECGKAATKLCEQCLIDEQEWRTFCDAHAESHEEVHNDYGEPVQLFNSPRVGMCGYEGPAEPPY